MKQFIVWGFDSSQDQGFADIIRAKTSDAAERAFVRRRGDYASLDSTCPAIQLDHYILKLAFRMSVKNRVSLAKEIILLPPR